MKTFKNLYEKGHTVLEIAHKTGKPFTDVIHYLTARGISLGRRDLEGVILREKERGRSAAAIARDCGVDPQSVTRWLSRHERDKEVAVRIQEWRAGVKERAVEEWAGLLTE